MVLHLLDSSGSVARDKGSPHGVAAELADLGLASLIVDYTGVGLSAGERSVRNLRGDARAAWEEALRRAGGDPERVVIRGISLGTIAAALLLDDGARPAAQVWILPVFPDTIATRFARFAYCGRMECIAWAFGFSMGGVGAVNRVDLAALFADLCRRTGSDEAARRQYVRLLLKHCRIPSRLRQDDHGRWIVEALEDERRVALDLEPAAGAPIGE